MIAVAEFEDFNQLLTDVMHMSHTGLPGCGICKTDAEPLWIPSEILPNSRKQLLLNLKTQKDKASLIEKPVIGYIFAD